VRNSTSDYNSILSFVRAREKVMVEVSVMTPAELHWVIEVAVSERGEIIYNYTEGELISKPE